MICWSAEARWSTAPAVPRAAPTCVYGAGTSRRSATTCARWRTGDRRVGRGRDARVHRHPHAPRPVAVLGSRRRSHAAARCDHGAAGELLLSLAPVRADQARAVGRRLQLRRRRAGERVRHQRPVVVGALGRVPRRDAGARLRGELGGHGGTYTVAHVRDGRRRLGAPGVRARARRDGCTSWPSACAYGALGSRRRTSTTTAPIGRCRRRSPTTPSSVCSSTCSWNTAASSNSSPTCSAPTSVTRSRGTPRSSARAV